MKQLYLILSLTKYMGQVLRGKGRFRRPLPGHFASSNSFPVERTLWGIAADVALAEGCPDLGGVAGARFAGGQSSEIRSRANRLLQVTSLAVLLCCIWVGKQ